MNNFIHLHVHSDYSLRDGAQSVKAIASRAKELGMFAVALTDHGNAGGLLQFGKACIKEDIKPIYGVELYVAPESRFLKEKIDSHVKTSYHLTVLAKNKIGLENLFELTSRGWTEGKYYKPRVDMQLLRDLSEGLVVLSGCGSGRLATFLMEDKFEEAIDHVKEMKDIWGNDLYIEMQNHLLEWQEPLNKGLRIISSELNIPLVITQDSHYSIREDAKLHNAICKLTSGDLQFDSDHSWFKSYNEICEMFDPDDYHAIHRTKDIAKKCIFDWEYGKTIWPVYDLPEGKTIEQEFEDQVWTGLYEKFPEPQKEYKERLKYEIDMIKQMGFPPYFLIVADIINWTKSQGIPVGPSRGSCGGSLVAYCLKITNIDPIFYGLFFERFINPARISLPDIDTDIDKERRHEVIKYIADKYGINKIAQIGTYSVFKPRGSLRAFARVCGYEPFVGHKLANMVPPDVAGKSLKFDKVIESTPELLKAGYDDVISLARKAEGLRNQSGVHAAGVVISNKEIYRQVPLMLGRSNEIVTQWDMNDIEDYGLVKIDFLGLKNLTLIAKTLKLIKEKHNLDIDIDKIEDKDQKVYTEIFNNGKLDGVFQFEGSSGFRDLAIKGKPKCINDLAALTSLYRPGPLGCGLTDEYINCRNGKEPEYLTPELKPILKNTYAVMTFQEQIMSICTGLAGYTLSEADNMRKIIGKKIPEKMKLEHDKFIDGCIKNNIKESVAVKLFDDIEGFASYCFNLAHAAGYSIITYQTAWLKTYYPHEFYTSLLNISLDNQNDMVRYIHAAKKDSIDILPPDINTSDLEFTLDESTIIFGLAGIKGLGDKGCQHLIKTRNEDNEFGSLNDLIKRKIKKDVITALAECGALESISEYSRNQIVENIKPLMEYFKKIENWEKQRDKRIERDKERLKAVEEGKKPPRKLSKLKERPELSEISEHIPLSKIERLNLERKTLGFYLTGHPLDDYPGLLRMAKYTISDIQEGKMTQNSEKISIPVVISSIKQKRSRKQKNYAVVEIEDQTGRIESTIFSNSWEKMKDKLEEGTINIAHINVRKVIIDKEAPPIINVSVNYVKPVNKELATKISAINLKLTDGTLIQFNPSKEQDVYKWQKAIAYANNLKRMGRK